MPLTTAVDQLNKKETDQSVTDLEIQMQDDPTFTITTADAGFEVGRTLKVTQQKCETVFELLGN